MNLQRTQQSINRQKKVRQFSFLRKTIYLIHTEKEQGQTGIRATDLRKQMRPRYFYTKWERASMMWRFNKKASSISYRFVRKLVYGKKSIF